MKKLQNVWVVSEQADLREEICAGARKLGECVTVLYAGEQNVKIHADKAYYLGNVTDEKRLTGYIETIVKLVLEKRPELVLIGTTKTGRLIAGQLAAACETSVITDISEISTECGVQAKRMVYGGIAYRTEISKSPVSVVCVGAGMFEADGNSQNAEIETAEYVSGNGHIVCRSVRKKELVQVNIAAAKRVVSVGRGIGEQEQLEKIKVLADRLGASMGCSRPIAEEMKWMPREAYVGVSGVMIKPELYMAVGISGQIQHMVGCNQSGTVIGINKDKNAPIFRYVDYGIVGDCKKVIPKLLEKLGEEV